MRFSVFSRGSNPAIDRPILHKSLDYVSRQVEDRLADWVDPTDPSKGIIAREFLPSGKALPPVTMPPKKKRQARRSGAYFGIRFIPPRTPQNPTIARVVQEPTAEVVAAWDWSTEPIPA